MIAFCFSGCEQFFIRTAQRTESEVENAGLNKQGLRFWSIPGSFENTKYTKIPKIQKREFFRIS